jgi:hypothetical protein
LNSLKVRYGDVNSNKIICKIAIVQAVSRDFCIAGGITVFEPNINQTSQNESHLEIFEGINPIFI